MKALSRYVFPTLFGTCLLIGGFFWLREGITSRIYREKIKQLSTEYAALAEQYNHAVRQTAVTELEVDANSVTVIIRTVEGTIQRIPTPFDPSREIFVDYLVGNGRIWIRRIFDEATPPSRALVIDPVWDLVDWDSASLDYGKIIYRALEPGLWSIQVSGNGSLSLESVERSTVDRLEASPDLRRFEEIRLSLDHEVENISLGDMVHFCTSLFRTKETAE